MKLLARPLPALATLGVTLLAGCHPGTEPRPRDGEVPGEHGPPGADTPLTPRNEPALVVGLDEDLPLHLVTGAVFFRDGIAIANTGSMEVLVLDPEGRVKARHGGRGLGPGEYSGLFGVARHGDGLVTLDTFLRRIDQLDAERGHVAGAPVDLPLGMLTWLVGTVGDVALLKAIRAGFPGTEDAPPREIRDEEVVGLVNVTDGRWLLRTTVPGRERWVQRKFPRHGGLDLIFGRAAAAAVAGERGYVATTDSLTLHAYDEAADVTLVHLQATRIPARPEWERFVRDSLRAAFRSVAPSRHTSLDGRDANLAMAEFRLELLEGLPARSTLPAFSDMKGDRDGLLWIRSYPLPLEDHVLWTAFDSTWTPVERLQVPNSMEILDLTREKILVKARGEFGEELLVVHGLERR